MKKIIFVVFITFLLLGSKLLASKIDSLKSDLKSSSKREKAKILNKLSKSYREVSLKQALNYANQAIKLSQEIGDKK